MTEGGEVNKEGQTSGADEVIEVSGKNTKQPEEVPPLPYEGDPGLRMLPPVYSAQRRRRDAKARLVVAESVRPEKLRGRKERAPLRVGG